MPKVPVRRVVCPLTWGDRSGKVDYARQAGAAKKAVATMYAHVGDRLVIDGDPVRTGLIIEIPHEDGSPPYVVKWLPTGHIAMVSPSQFARLIPASHPAGTGRLPLSGAGR